MSDARPYAVWPDPRSRSRSRVIKSHSRGVDRQSLTGLNFFIQQYYSHTILIIMAALCNRAGHYIFAMWFLLSSSFFFPRLISAVADWMSTILAHIMWPYCEFKTQVWNVLHGARCKYRTQKVVKNRHLGTIAQLCRAISSQLRHVSKIGAKTCYAAISPPRVPTIS